MTSPIEDVATRKLAGVPVWAWGAAVAVGVLLFVVWRNRTAGTVASSPDSVSTDNASVAGTGSLPVSPSVSSSSAPTTNAGWLTDAVFQVQSLGYSSLEVFGALSRFLDGDALSYDDQVIVNAAIAALGLPPDVSGLTLGSLAPAPPSSGGGDGPRNDVPPGGLPNGYRPVQTAEPLPSVPLGAVQPVPNGAPGIFNPPPNGSNIIPIPVVTPNGSPGSNSGISY